MSHHFDTPTAKEDPRINLCDFYLFESSGDHTVMVLTVNPGAGKSAPDTFRDEGVYAFRFDLDGDGREELAFRFRFGSPEHVAGNEDVHTQTYEVRRACDEAALAGIEGDQIAQGRLGDVVTMPSGVRTYAGLAQDLFAGDAIALAAFRQAFYGENRFAPEAFRNRKDFFVGQNVSAIVLEVPNHMIGVGPVRAWATVSLFGHAPEVPVSRWGIPLLTHLFMPDADMKEMYNRSRPSDDLTHFAAQVGDVVERMTRLAGSATNPRDYARRVVERLFPTTLPYVVGSRAYFDFLGFNGRPLADDAMDVMLSLMTNTALGDGVAPEAQRVRKEFPYVSAPLTEPSAPA